MDHLTGRYFTEVGFPTDYECVSKVYVYKHACQVGNYADDIIASSMAQGWGLLRIRSLIYPQGKNWFCKVPVRLFESLSYLTGVTAAELRRHLLNMNVIFHR